MKLNCWEYKKCGREPGGAKVLELGVCPVPVNQKMDNIHGGNKAGRTCWMVAGSFCNGEIQGSFVAKMKNCMSCDFYQKVKEEEGKELVSTAALLTKLL